MPATPITDPVSGESLVGTEPQLLQQVDPGWRRRLNLFTGRALSDTALDNEQLYRGGLLATLGQSVSAGTVSGLALTLDTTGSDARVGITPGYGIMANGQDVMLLSALKTGLATLPVIDVVTGEALLTFQQHVTDPTNTTHAGILLLQPVVAQVSGQMLDSGTGPIEVLGNLNASCDQDPDEYAFEDWQIADAVRLVYLPWPQGVPSLDLPALSPLPATWRNQLAYAIFEAESLLGADDQLPWATLGVPVALIGFDPGIVWAANTAFTAGQIFTDPNGNIQQVQTAGTSAGSQPKWNTRYGQTTSDSGVTWINAGNGWRPLFVDCSAVVRAGGLPRNRNVFPAQAAASLQWQPQAAFAVGTFIVDSNNNVQKVKTAGTSGAFEPAWNGTFNQTTTDGTVTWSNNGPGSWKANTTFAAGQFIYDEQGYTQTVQTAGTSGSAEPAWNSVYLPTTDGGVTWINGGSGEPPIIQPALAQARINQLSEQLGQTIASGQTINGLADLFTTLPPSGILPVSALDLVNKKNLWFPPNWSITAAPVHLEELETVLEIGMTSALLEVQTTAPSDATLLEPVEVLVPLPDQVYDPDILITETVAAEFQNEVDAATASRNITLQRLRAVQSELNTLYTVTGADATWNKNLIDTNAGLTANEIAGRNAPPPYIPAASETFGTLLQSTWLASTAYAAGQFVIDDNSAVQTVMTAGTSADAPPAWNTNVGASTTDGGITWLNNGPWAWQANTLYIPGQFVVDPQGHIQQVQGGGTSASSQPAWNGKAQQTTQDGITWTNSGKEQWQSDSLYQVGQVVLDSRGNIQIVQTSGISGDWPPAWNTSQGQTTQDNSIVWANLGHSLWQPGVSFAVGQAVLDPAGNIQLVSIGGTTGAGQPKWNEALNSTTGDTAITWINKGALNWQADTAYAAGQIAVDSNGNIQQVEIAGTSGATAPLWSTYPGTDTTDGGVTWNYLPFYSTDLLQIQTTAAQAPYTFPFTASEVVNGQTTQVSKTITLIGADDWADLDNYGLQHFITRLNAKVSQANDILDTSFLTVQTDIYRYRQNVLGATAASTLATSPILANIATGETAAATAENLQSYLNVLKPPAGSTTPAPVFTLPTNLGALRMAAPVASTPLANPVSMRAMTVQARTVVASAPAASASATTFKSNLAFNPVEGAGRVINTGTVKQVGTVVTSQQPIKLNPVLVDTVFNDTTIKQIDPTTLALAGATFTGVKTVAAPTQIVFPGVNATATATDITSQSPIAGAQLNLRTLTIAQRLQQSPSQEAMFYSIGNRLALLQLLQTLEITIDDLPILVDGTATESTSAAPPPPETHTFSEWFDTANRAPSALQSVLAAKLQSPLTPTDSAEATLFSVGIRVLEQQTMLLRALEARVQLYVDFINICTSALNSIQSDMQSARSLIQQLQNDLAQERQNVAFTTSLLADETQRVDQVNAQRTQILQSSVQLIAYTRARTLQPIDTAPSRQLVPANIANPVPACLQQSVSIPPELREIVGLLREAPVNWLPAVQALVTKLERPTLLQELVQSTQARAVMQLQMQPLPSSATGEPRVYAKSIATVYTSNQVTFRSLQTERANIQPAAMNNLSWSLQVSTVQSVVAVNDLISAESVHTEVSNATARLIQQISSVATCVYARAGDALPGDRLAWADFLTGPGSSAQLTSLAILPSWNDLTYTDRQQMQMLVDWLFQQIDTTNAQAAAFMSDVVRTAILLASDVPVSTIIPAGIITRTQPVIGGPVAVRLPSSRVSSGMFVNLYSGTELAARAVVSDLDNTTATATVTDIYKPGVTLETTDIAHFTAQAPQAVALRAFAKLS